MRRWADEPEVYFKLGYVVACEDFDATSFLYKLWGCKITVKTPAGT